MNVAFNKNDDLNATLTITLEPSDIMPEYEKQIKTINKKVNIPGFRPGMAPKGMIEKMYGDSTLADVVTQMAGQKLNAYLEENKLDILGQPITNDGMERIDKFTKDRSYEFIFDIGMAPQFDVDPSDLGPFNLLKLNADDKMLDDESEQIRKRYGNYSSVDEAQDNDIVKLGLKELDEAGNDLEGGLEKEVQFLISHIKDEPTKAVLLGAKKEDTVKVNIFNLFNDDHKEMEQSLQISHAAVHDLGQMFSAKVIDITRPELAEMNKELWDKVFGPDRCNSQEEFRQLLKEELEQYFSSQGDHIFEHDLTDALLAKYRVTLPDTFLKKWLLQSSPTQFNQDNIEEKYARESSGLRWQLIIEKVQALYDVKVEEEEIRHEAYIHTRQMFSQYGMSQGIDHLIDDMVDKQLKKEDYLRNMFHNAQNRKVMNTLKDLVQVNEQRMDSEDFFNAVREHNEKHHQHNHQLEDAHEHEHEHSHE